MASLLNMSGGSLLKFVERYLIFKDIDIWTVCCCNWGDYEEVVITDNGDNTVNIATTPVHMENTTSTRGTTTTEYNVDNTGGTYTAGTTKVPVGIKKSQCLAVTGIKGGILKLAGCRTFPITRSYVKTREIYGYKYYTSALRKADCYLQFDIDEENYMRINLYQMFFGYINGVNSYVNYPNFGYAIDDSSILCLFGQSSSQLVNGIGYFNSFVGYRPNAFALASLTVISEDAETLPYDAQVEYLQSSGTQYIELPYKPNQDTSMEISVAVAVGNGTANSQFFETRNAIWSREYALVNFGDSNNLLQARFGNKSGGTRIGYKMIEGTIYKIEYRKNDVYIDDTFVVSLTNYTFQSDYYLALFGYNNGGAITAAAGSPQIYYMKIYDGNTLAMDLIPVRKGQVGYMYDKISRQLLANAGTGDFILGQDIVPIEYLQSNGTQYIEINIVPDANTGAYASVVCSDNTDMYFFGLRDTNGNTRWGVGHAGGGFYYAYGTYGYGSNRITGYTAEVYLNWLNDGKYVAKNGTNTDETTLPSLSFTPAHKIYLFANYNALINDIQKWNGKIFAFKLTQGTDIVMDMIPVRVGTTGYMYDKISGQLFGNNGTGDFVLGPDKS